MLTLSIAGIQPIIMERLLLDRQLLGHKLRMEISPQKTEIEIYQRQKLLSPLLRMLIQMQIELLAITLLVSHLFFFHLNQFSFKQKNFLFIHFFQSIHNNYLSFLNLNTFSEFLTLFFRSITWTRNFWKSSFRNTFNNWRKSCNQDS